MPEDTNKKISKFFRKFIDNITFFGRLRYDIKFFLSKDLQRSKEYLDKVLENIEEEDVTLIKNKWKYPLSSLLDHDEGFDVDEYLASIKDDEKRSRVEQFLKGQVLYQLEQEYEIRRHFNEENLDVFLNRFHLLYLYSEFEQYLFSSFKFLILKYPDSLKEKIVSIKQNIEKNKDFNLILEEKAETVVEQLLRIDLNKFFKIISKKPYRFKVEFDQRVINELDEFKQLRNAYIHGDGTASLIYLSKIRETSLKLGHKLQLDVDLIFKKQELLFFVLAKFDKILFEKIPELSSE